MESSTELRDLVLRSYQSLTAGDRSFLEQIISHQPGVLNIGTDPKEWWSGYDTFLQVAVAQFQEMGGSSRIVGADPQAYHEGSVGWVADRPSFELPDGTQLPFRMTGVFHQEDGAWKLVQSHYSIGVSNEDVVGRELTTE